MPPEKYLTIAIRKIFLDLFHIYEIYVKNAVETSFYMFFMRLVLISVFKFAKNKI